MNIRRLYLFCLVCALVTACIESDPEDPASAAGSQTQAPDAPEAGIGDTVEGLCDDFYYQLCDDDDDCTRDGYRCGPIVEGCLASTCGCDAETGAEVCTADCLMGGRVCVSDAQVDAPEATGGSNAGTSGGSDAGLSGGSDAPMSGGSAVGTAGGADDGTAGTGGTATAGAEDLCADFYYQTCTQDSDCERDGYVCNDSIDGCISSTCDCDPETGQAGICTTDCGTGGLCEPRIDDSGSGGSDAGSTGGNDAGGGSAATTGGTGESGGSSAEDASGGSAAGTNDGSNVGVAGGSDSTDLCADFYYQTCTEDADCQRAGYVCGPIVNGCVSSTCSCDPNTGEAGICTADCGMGLGLCEPAR